MTPHHDTEITVNMSNDSADRNRAARAQLTPEAFRDLAETALEELYDNSDTFDLQDLRSWCRALSRQIVDVNDHAESGADVSEGMGALRLCDSAGN